MCSLFVLWQYKISQITRVLTCIAHIYNRSHRKERLLTVIVTYFCGLASWLITASNWKSADCACVL